MSRNKNKNYYDILGVSKTASADDIKSAYRDLCKKHHPDVGGDSEKMKDINEAYSILSDEGKRREYDNPPQPHFNPFTGGNPFGGHHASGFHFSDGGIDVDLSDILNNVHAFRFGFEGPRGGNFTSTQMINHTVKLDLIKALEGGDVEFDIPQIGKRIKFELPPDVQHGSNYRIRVAGDDKNQTILSITIEISLPKGLSKDKIGKIKEIISAPEVKTEEPKT